MTAEATILDLVIYCIRALFRLVYFLIGRGCVPYPRYRIPASNSQAVGTYKKHAFFSDSSSSKLLDFAKDSGPAQSTATVPTI
jgi:hypothetical protein